MHIPLPHSLSLHQHRICSRNNKPLCPQTKRHVRHAITSLQVHASRYTADMSLEVCLSVLKKISLAYIHKTFCNIKRDRGHVARRPSVLTSRGTMEMWVLNCLTFHEESLRPDQSWAGQCKYIWHVKRNSCRRCMKRGSRHAITSLSDRVWCENIWH
jgi:hypothetical protein